MFGVFIAQGAMAQLELDDNSTFGEARDCILNDADNNVACDTTSEAQATTLHEAVETATAALAQENADYTADQAATAGLEATLAAAETTLDDAEAVQAAVAADIAAATGDAANDLDGDGDVDADDQTAADAVTNATTARDTAQTAVDTNADVAAGPGQIAAAQATLDTANADRDALAATAGPLATLSWR